MATIRVTASRINRDFKVPVEIEWWPRGTEDDPDAKPEVETFFAFPDRVPGSILFDLTIISASNPAMWQMFEACMDDYPVFRAFIDDPDHGVKADTIKEIVNGLLEVDTGKAPTPPAS